MATRGKAPPADEVQDAPGTQQPGPGWGVTVNGSGPDDEDDDDPSLSLAGRVRAAFAANPETNSRLRLWRINPKDKKLGWCEDYSAQDFDDGFLDEVRSKWGPGRYELRLFGGTADSAKRHVLVREAFTIEATGTAPPLMIGSPPAGAGDSPLMAAMLENQNRILEALARQAPPPDPGAQMVQMFALMKGMREAMGPPPPPPPPPVDQFEMITKAMQALGMFKQSAKDLVDDKPEKEESLLTVAGPLIGNILDAMKSQQALPAPQQAGPLPPVMLPPSMGQPDPMPPAQPAQAIPLQPQPQPQPQAPEMNLQMLMLGGAVARLVALAKAGTPEATEQAAEFAANELPEEYLPLLDHEHDGKRWPLLTQALPGQLLSLLAPHQGWVETVLTRAAALLDEDDASGDDPAP